MRFPGTRSPPNDAEGPDLGTAPHRAAAAHGGDLRELAEHLASRPGDQLLDATEYEARDRVHRIGARAIEAAPAGREAGAAAGPA